MPPSHCAPGLTRSNAKDLFVANRPSPEFPGILWSAFCYGGFLYFGGDNKFLVANGLTEVSPPPPRLTRSQGWLGRTRASRYRKYYQICGRRSAS